MELFFSKYHGTGNDFIMVDSRKNVTTHLTQQHIERLCDRHFGIGADGLIILKDSDKADFYMDYYNADGFPGTMCGNGGRCTVVFAHECGWTGKKVTFEAADGIHHAEILENGLVELEMRDVSGFSHFNENYFLNTGSPHLIVFRDEIDAFDVFGEGRKLRYDNAFDGGTNVNFVEKTASGIKVRTYERGVEAETLSCGTGVTAAAIATFIAGNQEEASINVSTLGGELNVRFIPSEHHDKFTGLRLTGPVTQVFNGSISI